MAEDASTIESSAILQLVVRQLEGTIDVSSLCENTNLWDAGMDSLSIVSVMVAVEDEFDITFPDELLTRDIFTSPATIAAAAGSLCG